LKRIEKGSIIEKNILFTIFLGKKKKGCVRKSSNDAT